MRLPAGAMLPFRQGAYPILAGKVRYFADPEFHGLFDKPDALLAVEGIIRHLWETPSQGMRVMDRLEAMSLLIATVEAGSFSAASRKLGVPLPTISRKVAELESHLGTRILLRSTRKLTLTDAGMNYLAACKRILEQISEAETEAAGEYSMPKGELVITAPIVFGRLHVVPLVNEFLITFPEINIRMMLADRSVNLLDDHIDMAVRIGALADSSMVATRVGHVRRIVCGSPDYFASHGVPRTPDDLAQLTCVTFSGLPTERSSCSAKSSACSSQSRSALRGTHSLSHLPVFEREPALITRADLLAARLDRMQKRCGSGSPSHLVGSSAGIPGALEGGCSSAMRAQDMRRRGVPSPDEWDAIALTFAVTRIARFGSWRGWTSFCSRAHGHQRQVH